MPVEVAPLIGSLQPQQVDGVDLFALPNALIAVGGIGQKFARRAAEVAIEVAQPKLLVSAGMVGAISPGLKVGDVGRVREVVDVATGARYPGIERWRMDTGDFAGCERRRREAAAIDEVRR